MKTKVPPCNPTFSCKENATKTSYFEAMHTDPKLDHFKWYGQSPARPHPKLAVCPRTRTWRNIYRDYTFSRDFIDSLLLMCTPINKPLGMKLRLKLGDYYLMRGRKLDFKCWPEVPWNSCATSPFNDFPRFLIAAQQLLDPEPAR